MLKHGWQWQCWQQLTVEVDNLARKKEFLNGYRRQSLMWLSWAQTEAHSRHWAQRPWTHYQQCGFSFSVWQNLRGLLSVIVHQYKHCTDLLDMPGLNRTLRRTSAHTVYTTLCHSYCNSVAGHCNGISLSCNSAPSWWCIYRPRIKCSTEVVVCAQRIFTNLILLEVTLFTDSVFLNAQSTHNAAFCCICSTVNKYIHWAVITWRTSAWKSIL